MSKFGDYLRLLLERTGETVTSLSKKSGVERTSIHKAIKGERILPYKSLKNIEKSLCLTSQEILILREYHDVELQGENLFELRQQMIKMLNSLNAEYHVENKKLLVVEKQSEKDTSIFGRDMHYLKGENEIILALRRMIEWEVTRDKAEMQIYMPCQDSALQHYLSLFIMQYDTELQINHLCPYYLGEKRESIINAWEGISQLKYALDMAVLSGGKYKCFISYQKEKEDTPFPWYVITSQGVLMISDSSEREGFFIRQKDLVRIYQRKFHQKSQGTLPYIRARRANEEIESVILDQKETSLKNTYVIADQAGFAGYMPVKVSEERQLTWKRMPKDIYAGFYFSRSGIKRFVKDGILEALPKEFQNAFSVVEREEIISALEKDIRENRLQGRLVKGCRYCIAKDLQIYIEQDQSVKIMMERNGYNYFVQVDEIYTRKAFWDFAEYLAKSEEVESKEDTLEFLQECINDLREQRN